MMEINIDRRSIAHHGPSVPYRHRLTIKMETESTAPVGKHRDRYASGYLAGGER